VIPIISGKEKRKEEEEDLKVEDSKMKEIGREIEKKEQVADSLVSLLAAE
jgi:hypothetical protein